jgi:D-glycero-D-manno-heptose 1,7-bisphosphate phosphatase
MNICFLDRDGTLNVDVGYLHEPSKVKLVSGIKEVLSCLQEEGFQFIIVTNQSGLARGYFGIDEMEETNKEICLQLGITPLDIFYCPHLPDAKVETYRRNCDCRKPAPGLLLQALQKYPQINLKSSFLIGDSVRDCEAAFQAGVDSYLLGRVDSPLPERCAIVSDCFELLKLLKRRLHIPL